MTDSKFELMLGIKNQESSYYNLEGSTDLDNVNNTSTSQPDEFYKKNSLFPEKYKNKSTNNRTYSITSL